MKDKIKLLKENAKKFVLSFKEFPAEATIAFTAFLLSEIVYNRAEYSIDSFCSKFGYLAMLMAFCVRSYNQGKKGLTFYIFYWLPCTLLALPACYSPNICRLFDEEIFIGVILLMFASILCQRPTDKETYAYHFINKFNDIIISLAISVVAFVLYLFIDSSFIILFNIRTSEHVTSFLITVLFPLLFFYFQLNRKDKSYPIIKILYTYLLTPATVIMALIINVYAIKHFAEPEPASKEVPILFLLAILGYICHTYFQKNSYNKLYKSMVCGLVLPLCIFGYDTIRSISSNGVTVENIWAIVFINIMLTFMVFQAKEDKNVLNYCTKFGITLIALLNYMPFVRAVDLSFYCQRSHIANKTEFEKSDLETLNFLIDEQEVNRRIVINKYSLLYQTMSAYKDIRGKEDYTKKYEDAKEFVNNRGPIYAVTILNKGVKVELPQGVNEATFTDSKREGAYIFGNDTIRESESARKAKETLFRHYINNHEIEREIITLTKEDSTYAPLLLVEDDKYLGVIKSIFYVMERDSSIKISEISLQCVFNKQQANK